MATASPPPLLSSASSLSLGVTRTSKELMSEQLLSGEDSVDHRISLGNQIQLLTPRTIPGPCHMSNKGCIHWGDQGLVAYGANISVVVMDSVTFQPVQCLVKHKTVVKKVLWCPKEYGKLRLVSADMVGNIILWNVEFGSSEVSLQDGNKPVLDLQWVPESSAQPDRLPNLAALHSPYSLVIWDLNKESKLWKKSFTDTLLSFDFDPFNSTHLALLCPDCILFMDDFNVNRLPSSNGRKFYISSPRINDAEEAIKSKDRLKRLMRGLTVGEIKPRPEDSMTLSECLQLSYHRSLRHHIILTYARDILIIDLHINMTVGVIPIERSASPLVQVISSRQRDVLFCLHESGAISIKVRRKLVSQSNNIVVTPSVDQQGESSSFSRSSDNSSIHDTSNDLCIWYEHKCHCSVIRQSKGFKVLGVSGCPLSENKISLLLNSGKLIFLQLDENVPSKSNKPKALFTLSDLMPPSTYEQGVQPNMRLISTGVIQNSSTQITTIKMCPPLTNKNFLQYYPILAAGSITGNIFLFNISQCLLEKQYIVHNTPVRGIEWINLNSFVSWSYSLSSTSSNSTYVRNEVMLTDTCVNHSIFIRKATSEEPYIDILKVSPLKQFLIIVLKDGPFELWDIKKLQLLRIMPKKFPIVTALEWSSVNTKSKKNKHRLSKDMSKQTEEKPKQSDKTVKNFEDVLKMSESLSKSLDSVDKSSNKSDEIHVDDSSMTDKLLTTKTSDEGFDIVSTRSTEERSLEERVILNEDRKLKEDKEQLTKIRKDSEENFYKTRLSEEQVMLNLQTPGGSLEEDTVLPVKEYVVFTDSDSHLYYFIVEGNVLKNGMKIPPEENAKRVNYIALKHNSIIVQAHMDGMLNIWNLKAKKNWNKDMGRRWIRKMKFAPGKDNLKLLILFADGVDIIDLALDPLQDKIAQLKSPKDIIKIIDIDWASAELPIIITEDGSIYIMDINLKQTSSSIHKYTFQDSIEPFCLLSKYNYDILSLYLNYKQMYDKMPLENIIRNINIRNIQDRLDMLYVNEIHNDGTIDHCITMFNILGDKSLYNLFNILKYYLNIYKKDLNNRVAREQLLGTKRINKYPSVIPLDTCYDVFCDPYTYQKLELERVYLHECKRGDYNHTKNVVERLILLGETDKAVQLLLETQISNPSYYTDAIKACLVSTIQSTGAAQSTIKLVATNLIANERIWEGVQLLCLIGKGFDACKYLIQYGLWDNAVWLSKAILPDNEICDIYKKWAQYLQNQKNWYQSLLIFISLGQFENALDILIENNENMVACLLLSACSEYQIDISPNIKQKILVDLENQFKSTNIDIVKLIFSPK